MSNDFVPQFEQLSFPFLRSLWRGLLPFSWQYYFKDTNLYSVNPLDMS